MFKENEKIGFAVEKTDKKLDSFEEINKKIKELNWMVYAVMIFIFLGFLGILFSYFSFLSDNWRHKEDIYYQLLEKVNQNNCGFIKN